MTFGYYFSDTEPCFIHFICLVCEGLFIHHHRTCKNLRKEVNKAPGSKQCGQINSKLPPPIKPDRGWAVTLTTDSSTLSEPGAYVSSIAFSNMKSHSLETVDPQPPKTYLRRIPGLPSHDKSNTKTANEGD